MIIVMGHVTVDRTQRTAYVRACEEIVRQARSTPGCLDFAIAEDDLDPERVNVMERWVDRERLEGFRTAGPPFALAHQIREMRVLEFAAEELSPAET